jgi:hypothetical protein
MKFVKLVASIAFAFGATAAMSAPPSVGSSGNYLTFGGDQSYNFDFSFATANTLQSGSIVSADGDFSSVVVDGYAFTQVLDFAADGAEKWVYSGPTVSFATGNHTLTVITDPAWVAGADGYNGKLKFASTVDLGAPATFAPVPEPETYAMMLAGLGALGFVGRRRKAK